MLLAKSKRTNRFVQKITNKSYGTEILCDYPRKLALKFDSFEQMQTALAEHSNKYVAVQA